MTSSLAYYQQCKKFLSARINDAEITLFNPEDPEFYFGLSGTSLSIWELLDTPQSADQLLDKLSEIYEAERTIMEADVRTFLAELVDQKIVEIVAE